LIVWQRVFEDFRRTVIAGRLLRVTGRIQRDGAVIHLIAVWIKDLSGMLAMLARPVEGGDDGAGRQLPSSDGAPRSPTPHPREPTGT